MENFVKTKRIVHALIAFSVFSLILLAFMAIFPITYKSETVSAAGDVGASTQPELTMINNFENARVSLPILSSDGTFSASKEEEKAKFKVTTNNATGYTLTIIGENDTRQLVSAAGGYFDSITSEVTEADFSTSGATGYNGKWGIRPSKFESSENTTFRPAPTTTAQLKMDETRTPNSTPNEYSIGIGARADYSTPSGAYSGRFTLSATANPVPYKVIYTDETGEATNIPGEQSGNVEGVNTITLTNAKPSRTNYTFLKWCYGNVDENSLSCEGTTYNSGATFTLDSGPGDYTLKAVWSPNILLKTPSGISDATIGEHTCNSTDINASAVGCVIEGLEYGHTYNLTATIKDGYTFNKWELGSGVGIIANNTSINNATFTVGAGPAQIIPKTNSNTYEVTLDNDNPTTEGTTTLTATSGEALLINTADPTKENQITVPKKQYHVTGFDTLYNNAAGAVVEGPTNLTSNYGLDGWYSGSTKAIELGTNDRVVLEANTIYANSYSQWQYTSNVTFKAKWTGGSITLPTIRKTNYTCGWSTSTSTVDYQYMSGDTIIPTSDMELHGVCKLTATTYNVAVNFASNGINSVSFAPTSGATQTLTASGSVSLSYGVEYTVTADINTGSYNFGTWALNDAAYGTLGSTTSNPTTFTPNENSGSAVITVTTVPKGDITTLTYMQDVTPEIIAATADGTTKTLTDIRDNKQYTVGKIDGVLWMTKNLAFKGDTLTPADSNVPEEINIRQQANYQYDGWYNLSGANQKRMYYADSGDERGYWYNYKAATAGTYNNGDDNPRDSQYSICPAGWRLPNAMEAASVTAHKAEFNPARGGYYTLENEYWRNPNYGNYKYYGFYYTSTSVGKDRNLWLRYYDNDSTTALSIGSNTRYDGIYVRCVGDTGEIDSSELMQNVTTTEVNSMPEGYRAYMTDNRDGHVYSVAKIGDKLWMTRNLSYLGIASIDNLDASIYSDSSNVSSNTFFSWTKSTQESTAKPYFYPSNQSTTTNNKDFVAIPTERGNWYNYAGATANTIIGVSNSNNATYDICPKGWRLPTKSEFETLASSNRMDLFIPMDGFFYDITLISTQGTYYWSATSNSATSRYMLKYTNDITQGASVSVITQTRYDLRYVRCIFGG